MTQNRPTTEQLEAIKRAALAILEAITAAGEHGIPSGHLYAALMGKMDLNTYNQFVNALIKADKITQHGYLLKAVKTV